MRWKRHISNLHSGRHRRKDFVEWFKDRGSDAAVLAFRILEECPEDSEDVLLNELEIKWFGLHKPKFYGKLPSLNDTWQHSEETKRKIAEGVKRTNKAHGHTKMEECQKQVCRKCGKSFSRNKKQKFCSPACGVKKKLTSEDELLIMEMSATMSTRQIAAEFNVSHVTVFKVIKKNIPV